VLQIQNMNEAHDIIGKFMAEVVNEGYDSYLDTDNTELTELQKVRFFKWNLDR